MGDPAAPLKGSDRDGGPAVLSGSAQYRLLKLSSRVGVWGLLVGAYSFLGMPLPHGFDSLIPGLGLFVGGIGTFLTSSIVSLRLRGRFRILEMAAIVGLGLGVAACLLGAAMLLGVPDGFEELVVLTWLAVPVLGLALILLFGMGVVKRLLMKEGSGPEFT